MLKLLLFIVGQASAIGGGAIAQGGIANGEIDTNKIRNGAVQTEKIAPGAINTSHLQGLGSVPTVGSVLCVKGSQQIGYCSTTPTNGICTCN